MAHRRVLVLGGGDICVAIAQALIREGARVAVADASLARAKAAAESSGAVTVAQPADTVENTAASVEAALEALGGLDVLITLPGPSVSGTIADTSPEKWGQALHDDLFRVYGACRAAARPMMKQRHGRIVNVAMGAGLTGCPGMAAATAAAGALTGFTKTIAREMAGRGVLANVVAVGLIEGEMSSLLPAHVLKAHLTAIPLGRPGRPGEAAALIVFLASDEASYITGQVISLDGGWVMR